MNCKKRLTTDEPVRIVENMLNFAYAKDGKVFLRTGENDTDVCEYIAHESAEKGCNVSAKDVIDGACMDCDCPLSVIYYLSTQAAELRGRLKEYEDLCEEGRLIELPCKVGDTVYFISNFSSMNFEEGQIYEGRVTRVVTNEENDTRIVFACKDLESNFGTGKGEIGEWVFFTKEEAKKRLEELRNENI